MSNSPVIPHVNTHGAPITADDATIAAALQEASVPTLMLSMIHMTGDASLLEGTLRPYGIYLNEVQGFMPEEAQAAVRAQALEVVKKFRDGGCKLPPPPSPETILAMMKFLVVGDVPAEYVPMVLEELGLEGDDTRHIDWGNLSAAKREGFPVLIIGAGMSGILAGIRLQEAGIPFTIVEKNAKVGGTWHENRYPGCRVDVGNHFYCYSFEPSYSWTEFFAQHGELQAYFERCVDKYGLREHIRFNTEVLGSAYDEASKQWKTRIRGNDGKEETLVSSALISGVGQLNRPNIPDMKGRERFKGTAVHTAQWPDGLSLKGKRVAVIGTGASAFQLVPAVADEVAEMHVYQRSAPWMFPNPHYHRQVGEGKKWLLEHLPYYARWYRFLLFWPACDGVLPILQVDPAWPHQDRSVSEGHDNVYQTFTAYLKEQVGDDPELLAKVIPDYVPLAKRTLQDNGSWLRSLKKPNVHLIADEVVEITETGVVTKSGKHQEVDVIVWATGFKANRFLWPMDITGRGGVKLEDQWGDNPDAYLGVAIPNFPNLFCLYGPGTNLAFGGSLIFQSECQVRYTMGCIKGLLESGQQAIEVKPEVAQAYDDRKQAALSRTVWASPTLKHSYYQNASGKVVVLSPWRLLDYWNWTKAPNLAEYRLD